MSEKFRKKHKISQTYPISSWILWTSEALLEYERIIGRRSREGKGPAGTRSSYSRPVVGVRSERGSTVIIAWWQIGKEKKKEEGADDVAKGEEGKGEDVEVDLKFKGISHLLKIAHHQLLFGAKRREIIRPQYQEANLNVEKF